MNIKYDKFPIIYDTTSCSDGTEITFKHKEPYYNNVPNDYDGGFEIEIDVPEEEILKFYYLMNEHECQNDGLSIYCYGNEMPIIYELKRFFDSLEDNKLYSYSKLTQVNKNEALTWFIIMLLDKHDYIDYGTSLRYGWISGKGLELKKYFDKYPIGLLYKMFHKAEEILFD